MGDEDEGPSILQEPLFQPLDSLYVEVVGGLVEEEELGAGRQGPREGRLLDHPSGHLGQEGVGARQVELGAEGCVGELQVPASRGLDLGIEGSRAAPYGAGAALPVQGDEAGAAAVEEVPEALAGSEDGALLEQGHAEAALAGYDARVRLERAFEESEEGGLAPSVAADEADALALVDAEAHAFEKGLLA